MKIEIKKEHLPIIKQKFGYEVAEFCKQLIGLQLDRRTFQKKIQYYFENSYCNALANRVKTNEFLFELYSIVKVDLYDEIINFVRKEYSNLSNYNGDIITPQLQESISCYITVMNEHIMLKFNIDFPIVSYEFLQHSLIVSCLSREEFQQKMLYRNFL